MCIGAAQKFIDDVFGREQEQQVIEFDVNLQDFMSAGVNIDGVDYQVVGENLQITGTVDPFEVKMTLDFFGIDIPIVNFQFFGTGSDPQP